MSAGGIFALIYQNDISDTLFTASSLLTARLAALASQKIPPSIKFIEQSHVMYTKASYTPYVKIASEYVSLGTRMFTISNAAKSFTIPLTSQQGDFLSDCVLHVTIKEVGDKNAYKNNIEPTSTTPLYRYCAYPGIRLFENISFNSSGFVIDSYTPEDVISYRNFFVKQDSKAGWNRCFGQDEIQQATYNSKSFTGIINYSNGYQTPKLYQDEFNMFIPLRFWFCEDVNTSLILVKVSSAQRNFTFTITSLDKILQSLIYNVSEGVPPNITQVGTTITPLPITQLQATVTLYGNLLYTTPEIMSIINNDVKFSLVRVHKQLRGSLQSGENLIQLKTPLTYPGEYLMIGFRNKNNNLDFDRWHLMGSDAVTTDTNHSSILHVPAIIWNTQFQIRQLVVREAVQATSMFSVMNTIGLTVGGGITVYPKIDAEFYNSYIPIRYTKNTFVVSPLDNNMFLITFALYPGKYNPSGYFNFCTNNTLMLNCTLNSEFDSIATNFDYIVCMSALNFLKYDNNSTSDSLSLFISM